MKIITSTEELAGKVVKSAYFATQDGLIQFTDGSFVAFEATQEYGDTYLRLNETPEDYHLYAAGIMSKEEYDSIQMAKRKKAEEGQRHYYEELKRKFGDAT